LIALIPCSFASFIKNRGSVKRILFKIPVYALYFSVVVMAVVFIMSLPPYVNFGLCKIDMVSTLCVISIGVVPFGFIWLATWALIMLFMLLRDRILSRRRNRVFNGGGS
jgi:riboflavin transporter FmnP